MDMLSKNRQNTSKRKAAEEASGPGWAPSLVGHSLHSRIASSSTLLKSQFLRKKRKSKKMLISQASSGVFSEASCGEPTRQRIRMKMQRLRSQMVSLSSSKTKSMWLRTSLIRLRVRWPGSLHSRMNRS